ncbi:MAG: 1,4-alpha-glucan branching protein GlgB [Erysipelotrichales bacterium]|nr:1,4-alpha-glucan branching protein GlgB [Erysipelotrichales bacterium]
MRKYTDQDAYYYKSGKLFDSYQIFGAHYDQENKTALFRLYAPNAIIVSVIGDFNKWLPTKMNSDQHGVFEVVIDNVNIWDQYKYILTTKQGEKIYKADPYAFFSSDRPETNSKIVSLNDFNWEDADYLKNIELLNEKPILIYEMHLGSWKKDKAGFVNYRQIAFELISYLLEHNFTHVEFLPLYEYPLDESWGYMGTGYFSVTSRYGTPDDLKFLINELHKANIGVIFDWAPGHICKDNHGLYLFDGTPLYEYSDESIRENLTWGTANLDLGKGISQSFMISVALYWLKNFHIDGFRIDAVANLIYYLGDSKRGVNEGALAFLKKLSEQILAYKPNCLLIAEDSTNFPKVTHKDGLGFNFKWNMGWMNDCLQYFELDPIYRKHHHHNLTFGSSYAFTEMFVLPFSHDEIVHGKKSMLDKMPGDYWQKFANYRALLGFWLTFPGKKLIFMGSEFGQFIEWDFKRELDFFLLAYPVHQQLNNCFKALTAFYRKEVALYQLDNKSEGFRWIDADNIDQSVYAYLRYAKNPKDYLIIVLNCTPNTYQKFSIGVPELASYQEVFNTDNLEFGGSGVINKRIIKAKKENFQQMPYKATISLAPLSITIFKRKVKKYAL